MICCQFSTQAQMTARNPEIIQAKNPGKIVKLRKIAAAHNGSGDFVFKKPYSLKLTDDGSFFLIDNGQVLKFGKDGAFEKTIVRKGQGPGEATYLYQLYLKNRELIVNTGFMVKLMVFDYSGNLIAEYRQRRSITETTGGFSTGESVFSIMGHTKSGDFVTRTKAYKTKKDIKLNQKQYQIMLLSKENEWKKPLFKIPVKALYFKTFSGMESIAVHSIESVCSDEFIFFCNTERYQIKRYRIDDNKVDATWKREYKPVLIPGTGRGKYHWGERLITGSKNGKSIEHKAPQRKDFIDIQQLLMVNGRLWVVTSAVDKENGVRVDVFDQNGTYIEYFYLSFPGSIDPYALYQTSLHLNGDMLLIRETDDDGNYVIVKYKLQTAE